LDPLIKSQLLYQLSYTPIATGDMGSVRAACKRALGVPSRQAPVHPSTAKPGQLTRVNGG
jgi:hypothetical protein